MKKIIIVDDDRGWLKRLENALKSCHYDISCYRGNTSRLRARLKNDDYHLFITDILLDHQNLIKEEGMELANIVRDHHDNLPIILVSGFETKEIVRDAFVKLKVNDFIFKISWDKEYFLYAVKQALQKGDHEVKYGERKNKINMVGNKESELGQYACDIAIITALFDDEFENIEPLFDLKLQYPDKCKLYHMGEVKIEEGKKKSIRIVAAHQPETGMIDASIIATEIITKFNPKFLIMTGVCGGKDDKKINFGDIIIANKVFTFQKGKYTEEGMEQEIEECKLDPKIIQLIKENKKSISRKIMDDDPSRAGQYKKCPLQVHIEPMACSTSVINKDGFFEEIKKLKDRKTIAVDMESYAIGRACELANDGRTKAIIIKSVMDKTKNKNDEAKSYAAYTSAQFLKYLIKDVIMEILLEKLEHHP